MLTRDRKIPGPQFYQKTSCLFGIHRTSHNHLGTVAPSNQAKGLYGTSFSQDNVCEFNKIAWMATGAEKSQEQVSPRKSPTFLKFLQPVAPLWVLYLSPNIHMVFRDCLIARANFAKSMEVLGWKTSAAKCGSTIFRKRGRDFF